MKLKIKIEKQFCCQEHEAHTTIVGSCTAVHELTGRQRWQRQIVIWIELEDKHWKRSCMRQNSNQAAFTLVWCTLIFDQQRWSKHSAPLHHDDSTQTAEQHEVYRQSNKMTSLKTKERQLAIKYFASQPHSWPYPKSPHSTPHSAYFPA